MTLWHTHKRPPKGEPTTKKNVTSAVFSPFHLKDANLPHATWRLLSDEHRDFPRDLAVQWQLVGIVCE